MEMQVKEETGFGAIEMLLSLIIVVMITFIGYYIYNTQKKADETYAAVNHSLSTTKPAVKTKTSVSSPLSKDWYEYTAPDSSYSIRLADGWQLTRYLKSSALYAPGSSLAPKNAVKATVTEVNGGKDGLAAGLMYDFVDTDKYIDITGFTKLPDFKTAAGLTVNAYTKTAVARDSNYVDGLNDGGVYYRYVVKQSATKIFNVFYGVNPGETDYHVSIKDSIKTLKIK